MATERDGPADLRLAGNLADLVGAAARRGLDHPALIEDSAAPRTVTWAELDSAVDAESARLAAAGVAADDRVLIRLPNGISCCVALLGALRAGAAAVPVGPGAAEPELATIMRDCEPRAAVAAAGDAVLAAVAVGCRVLAAPEIGVPREPRPPVRRGGGEGIAVLGYTSGSSGVPRGARLTHRALLANRAQVDGLRPAPVTPADRVLLTLPLFHIFGLAAGLLQVCWAGATAVLVDRFDPADTVETIIRYRVTVVAAAPSMYRAWLDLPAPTLREGFASVRLCTAGGAPLAPVLLTGFREAAGLEVFEGYGLTETAPVLTTNQVSGVAKPGSVGRPLRGVELRLIDATDEDGDTDTGIVAVRGPNLFSGYWPDGAGGPDADGWFRTGDVGFIDADGDLHLVDRTSDLVIVNGFNVYPREVEQVLAELAGVAEAAVVGVPDERTGEAVKAVVVCEPGAELTADQVRAHAQRRLPRFKVPNVIEFADGLPHSATGKIRRSLL